jgi:hypothetical protein
VRLDNSRGNSNDDETRPDLPRIAKACDGSGT